MAAHQANSIRITRGRSSPPRIVSGPQGSLPVLRWRVEEGKCCSLTDPECPSQPRPACDTSPSPKPVHYYDWDENRRRMEAERKRMEELLKTANKPKLKDIWDVQILKKPRFHLDLPPTPNSADRANRDNVRDFNDLKHRDFNRRDEFRHIYPDVPVTNRQLEEQQEALLRHQGSHTDRPRDKRIHEMEPRRAASGTGWLDERTENQRENTSHSDKSPRRKRGKLTLRDQRKYSTATLTDDTWIQPSHIEMA